MKKQFNRVYIAGKVTGLDTVTYTNMFNAAKNSLEKIFDYEIVNPILLGSEQYTWEENMKFCIQELLQCDMVVFIPGWRSPEGISKGASLEYAIAKALGYKLYEFDSTFTDNNCFSNIHEIE